MSPDLGASEAAHSPTRNGVPAGQTVYYGEMAPRVDTHSPTLGPLSAEPAEPALRGTDTAEYRRLESEVDARLEAERRPNTVRAREQDWRSWREFCSRHGQASLRVSEAALATFAADLADGGPDRAPLAPASILRRISGVVCGWRAAGLVIPEGVSDKARLVATNHERRLQESNLPIGRGQAPALDLRDLRRICRALPDSPGGIRDRALILVGFGIAARRSELAHLDVTDVRETSEGLDVTVRFSKTRPRNPGVPHGRDATCPVLAWRAWLAVSGVTDGAAFRQVSCHGHIGGRMSPRAVGAAIRRAGVRADPDLYITGHSLRAGLATEARRAGSDIVQIARQGGWSETSDSLYRYIRTVDKWTDNAVRGIGL